MSSKLCECGCGQPTKLASKTSKQRGWVKGEPLRFINGHNDPYKTKANSKLKKTCGICGVEYYVWPSRDLKTRYCSPKCLSKANSLNQSAKEMHTKKTSSGYLQIKLTNHPFCDRLGYVMLHRTVLESNLGYFLDPKEYDVHHIDEDKLNNAVNNLIAMRKSAHMRLHARKRARSKHEF